LQTMAVNARVHMFVNNLTRLVCICQDCWH